MFLMFPIIHFRESNQILKDFMYNDDKRELKEKTQDANFSLPIRNLKSAIKKRIPHPDSKIGPKIGRIPDSDCQP